MCKPGAHCMLAVTSHAAAPWQTCFQFVVDDTSHASAPWQTCRQLSIDDTSVLYQMVSILACLIVHNLAIDMFPQTLLPRCADKTLTV